MIIHTLGPQETDSNDAAHYYVQQKLAGKAQITLHDSYAEIIQCFSQYQNDFFLVPTAFKSAALNITWGELHYQYLDQLLLQDCFMHRLNPLVIIENCTRKNGIAYSHPATAKLLTSKVKLQHMRYSSSKYLAYQQYLCDGQYVLTNEKNIALSPNEKIVARYEPQMIWSLYQIKG
ncbi:hypothetical protein JCM15457_1365 [Liquorilactobacillus sucicola DSM 21376 = JCM 15457]|uniref:hypothetical protein n=1 Tax=Liquorilactobacillus sucicola TaxID=519050 RepID=UPI00043437C9|nr:hypothetical protein [Liquorilactobacillus sucicola]GAJ26437.1 hypothetical protein JCM15457_1365 [Liquorilactobacillus sucicola DSM 21376 = JCM 15457]